MTARTTLMLITLLLSQYAEARQIPPQYQKVAREFDVPVAIFYALALTESGYSWQGLYRPWPWTLNIGGSAHRFQNYGDALRALLKAQEEGKRPDVGLMQVNAYWHRERVQSIHELLNPYTNLMIAAQILTEQRKRSSDWWEAVGHAPSQDKASISRAKAYRERVRVIYQQIETNNQG